MEIEDVYDIHEFEAWQIITHQKLGYKQYNNSTLISESRLKKYQKNPSPKKKSMPDCIGKVK